MKKMMAMFMAMTMTAGMTGYGSADTAADGALEGYTAAVSQAETEIPSHYVIGGETGWQEESGADVVCGGWTIPANTSPARNPRAAAALRKALGVLTGAEYQAVAVLGTQVVAGTNYAILCKVTPTVPDAQSSYELVYVYEDLSGNAEITGTRELLGGNGGMAGGWQASENSAPAKNPEATAALNKALGILTGAEYQAVAVLGTQVVAGTNYCILCKVTPTVPDAQSSYELVYVYEDLSGNAEITECRTIELGETDACESGEDSGEENCDNVSNPWCDCETAEEAAKAAGIDFGAPEKLGTKRAYLFRAMTGIAEARYGSENREISFRKGTGSEDISGDCNTYRKIKTVKVRGVKVTLRMNGAKVYGAVWTDGDYSYAYSADKGVTKAAAKKHIAKIMAEN